MFERWLRFFRRVRAIARKEVLHILRDPRSLYMAIGMPALLIAMFGYGVRFELDHLPIVVVDQDRTPMSRDVGQRLVASGDLDLAGLTSDPAVAEAAMRRGEAVAAVVLPQGLEDGLLRGERVPVQAMVDGSDGPSANAAMATLGAMAPTLVPGSPPPPISAEVLVRYDGGADSASFFVPGTIAYVLALVAVLLTALTVAREWERGSMEQLFSTPVGRLEIVLGKLAPYLALAFLDVIVALAAGAWLFGLPLRGNLLVVAFGSLLFVLGMLAQGLFISVITRDQMIATQVGALSSILPSMLLSGFIYPVENMPLPLYGVSHIVPARWYIALLRAELLKDAPFTAVWHNLVALALFAAVMIIASTARFQRRLA